MIRGLMVQGVGDPKAFSRRIYTREEVGRMTLMDIRIINQQQSPPEPGMPRRKPIDPGSIKADPKRHRAAILARKQTWEPWS